MRNMDMSAFGEARWRAMEVVGNFPCFFHPKEGERAVVEKQGKSVCRNCADGMRGWEFPLRGPKRTTTFDPGFLETKRLDMLERL